MSVCITTPTQASSHFCPNRGGSPFDQYLMNLDFSSLENAKSQAAYLKAENKFSAEGDDTAMCFLGILQIRNTVDISGGCGVGKYYDPDTSQ